jgi:hypothetical protein
MEDSVRHKDGTSGVVKADNSLIVACLSNVSMHEAAPLIGELKSSCQFGNFTSLKATQGSLRFSLN